MWRTNNRAATLYSVGRNDPDHDAVMRIGGEAPGRRVHSTHRLGSHGFSRITATSDRHRQTYKIGCQADLSCCFSFLSMLHAYDVGRNTMPSDTSPVMARRQRAMSSFRANATIIVLRVLPRPSAVRT